MPFFSAPWVLTIATTSKSKKAKLNINIRINKHMIDDRQAGGGRRVGGAIVIPLRAAVCVCVCGVIITLLPSWLLLAPCRAIPTTSPSIDPAAASHEMTTTTTKGARRCLL